MSRFASGSSSLAPHSRLAIPRTTRWDYKNADKSISTDERASVAQEAAVKALSSKKPDMRTAGDAQ